MTKVNREVTVQIKDNQIFIITPFLQQYNPRRDMGVLCEGICAIIHTAHKKGIKKDFESLKSCIKHLEDGFADESYKTTL